MTRAHRTGFGALGAWLALSACTPPSSAADAATLVRGRDALLRQRPADAATCAGGGVILESGRDLDGDGVLDDDEVEDSVPVCNGDDGLAARDEQLVASRAETLAECDGRGGAVLTSGIDDDDDGAIDEVQERVVLCDGEAGVAPTLLYDLTTLEPGDASCATGGLQLRLGADVDGDGALDDDEVEAALTRTVCNGPVGDEGAAGPAGAPALVAPVTVPSGACPAGGAAFAVGVDVDGDGVLDAAEIDDTLVLCDGLDAVAGGGGGGGGGRSEGSVAVPISLALQDELAPGQNGTRTVGALGRSRYVVDVADAVSGAAVYTVVVEGAESDVDVLVETDAGFVTLPCRLFGARRECVTPRLPGPTLRVDIVEGRGLPATFLLGVAIGATVGVPTPVPLSATPTPAGVLGGRASLFVIPAATLAGSGGRLLALEDVQQPGPPAFSAFLLEEEAIQLEVRRGSIDGEVVQTCFGTIFPCSVASFADDAVVVVTHRAGRGASFSLRAGTATEVLPLLQDGDVVPNRAARIPASPDGGSFTLGARNARLRVFADVDALTRADLDVDFFETLVVQLPPGEEQIVVLTAPSTSPLTRRDRAGDEGVATPLAIDVDDAHTGAVANASRYRIERPAGGQVTARLTADVGRVTCAFFADEALSIPAGSVPVARGLAGTRAFEQTCVSDDLPVEAPLFLQVTGQDAVFELTLEAGDTEHPVLDIDAAIRVTLGGGALPRTFRLRHGDHRGPLRVEVFATVDAPETLLFVDPPSSTTSVQTVVASRPGLIDYPVLSTFAHVGVSTLATGPQSYLTFVPTLVSSDLELRFSQPPVIDVVANTDVVFSGDEGRFAPDSERWFRFSCGGGSALIVRATTSAINLASRVRLWREGDPVPLTDEVSFRSAGGLTATLTPSAGLPVGTCLARIRTPHRDVLNVVRTDPIDSLRFEVQP
jgi:hypothetical protein